jgi:putative membrane protein
MKNTIIAAAFAVSAVMPAAAQDLSGAGFVAEAASSDLFEIRSSEIALERAESAEVREFAQEMINDHTAVSKRLGVIAEQEGIQVPTVPEGAPADLLATVEAADGPTFDVTYAQAQVAGHEAAVALYSSYAETGDNEALRSFASENLPTLQQHLTHAEELSAD